MNRHPGPTPGTVRELYGTSTHCAEPTCAEPLYRQVPQVGVNMLNSTIAHICASSPQGPRFDPVMSAEENRSAGNLLLLCHFHSRLIDSRAHHYSVELLREWKRLQLTQEIGVVLDDQQVEEILQVSIQTDLLVQADVINLGGQWGGGGGAIGAGAVGGPGGDSITINADGAAPGGGGGAVGGPGRTPPDARRATLGRAHVPGLDGGDTYLSNEDGEVLAKAVGGHAPGAPYDQRKSTDALKVSSLMLCNYSEIHNGLVFVAGGAWESLSLLNVPAEQHLLVQMVIEAGGVPAGHYSLHLSLSDSSALKCGQARFPLTVEEPGDVLRTPVLVSLSVQLREYGAHVLNVASDTEHLASVVLAVKRITDAP